MNTSGSPTQQKTNCSSIAEVSTLVNSAMKSGDCAYVNDLTNGIQALYYYVEGLTIDANSTTVLATQNTYGRFVEANYFLVNVASFGLSGGNGGLAGHLVQLVSMVNITLSGLQTVAGVTTTAGDRVLLMAQTAGAENGIWVVQAGTWTRPIDWVTGTVFGGTLVMVESGGGGVQPSRTWSGDSIWQLTSDSSIAAPIVVDTDAVAFQRSVQSPKVGYPVGAPAQLVATNGVAGADSEVSAGYGPYATQIGVARTARLVGTSQTTLNSTQTVDGVATADGDRVLLTGQTAGAENGFWIANFGLAWTRPTDWTHGSTLVVAPNASVRVLVTEGTLYRGSSWRLSTIGVVTVDTTATVWAPIADAGVGVNRQVRLVSCSAALNLASTGLTAIDGVTPVAGDRILVANQGAGGVASIANGIYIASAGTWVLAPDWNSTSVKSGMMIEVSEGTAFGNTSWKLTTSQTTTTNGPPGLISVGTNAISFYPRFASVEAQTLVNSAVTVTSIPIFSTKSEITFRRVTPVGTATTIQYNPSAVTPGGVGTASLTMQAQVAAGTASATPDTSTGVISVTNF